MLFRSCKYIAESIRQWYVNMLQAAEASISEQQEMLQLLNTQGYELKESLQLLLPSKPVDTVDSELRLLQDSWQLTADVS